MELHASSVSDQRPTLIAVLGMHRSGTSVAARLMQTMGADLGDRLWPAGPDNPKGFFEDSDVIDLNVKLMEAVGVDWQALPTPDFGKLDAGRLAAFRQRAVQLLNEKCAGGMLALKDPRFTRLLPFWLPIFDEFEGRVLYVVPFRHPLSVAQSLEKRNKIPHSKSHLLWLAHVVPALVYTQNRPRALLNYDRLMEAPGEQLQKLAKALALSPDPEQVRIFEQEFLADELRHTTFGFDDLDADADAPAVLKALFRALVAVADDPTPANLGDYSATLAQAEAFLRNVEPILGYALGLERHIGELYEAIEARHTQAVALGQAIAEATEKEAEAQRMLAESNGQLEAMAGVRRQLDEANERLDAMRADHDRRVAALDATIEELKARLAGREQALAEREATIADLTTSMSWRITAPLRVVGRYFRR